jgi:hypothetical protein
MFASRTDCALLNYAGLVKHAEPLGETAGYHGGKLVTESVCTGGCNSDVRLQIDENRIVLERRMIELPKQSLHSGKNVDLITLDYQCKDEKIKLDNVFPKSSTKTQLDKIAKSLDITKLGIRNFSGDPLDYSHFVSQFETHVELELLDEDLRLSCLLYYTNGLARRAIERCVLLPATKGYVEARRILANLFGRPHKVANKMLDILITGKLVMNNADDLMEFGIELKRYEVFMKRMYLLDDLNAPVNIEKLMLRMERGLCWKWAEWACDIYDNSIEPSFADFLEFVETMSRKAGSRYAKVLHTKRADAVECFQGILSCSEGDDKNRCASCNQNHELITCATFIALSPTERSDFVKKCGLCFQCLGTGHLARSCISMKRCPCPKCGKSHHQLLHVTSENKSVEGRVSTCLKSKHRVIIKDDASNDVSLVPALSTMRAMPILAIVDNFSESLSFLENKLVLQQKTNLSKVLNGHFATGLLWKIDCHEQTDTKILASKSLRQLQNCFGLDLNLRHVYMDVVHFHFVHSFAVHVHVTFEVFGYCLLYTSPSPRD